jgi:hypothetical protein
MRARMAELISLVDDEDASTQPPHDALRNARNKLTWRFKEPQLSRAEFDSLDDTQRLMQLIANLEQLVKEEADEEGHPPRAAPPLASPPLPPHCCLHHPLA